jgi:hypothetical protein
MALRASFAKNPQLAPKDQELTDEALAMIRQAIGPSGLDESWAEGSALDFHGAMRAILEFTGPVAHPVSTT